MSGSKGDIHRQSADMAKGARGHGGLPRLGATSANIRAVRRLLALSLVVAVITASGIAVAARGPSAVSAEIRSFANRWLGTRYQWGGDAKSGIDCSAYLRQMFRDLFNLELPRTTKGQIHLGQDIEINARALSNGLLPGDMIFYVDRVGVPNHVVVYMGDGRITHSVSGRGVVVDPIRQIAGRRIVARRMLVPGTGGSGGFGPIPPAGPIIPKEIPCPEGIVAKRNELRTYAREGIATFDGFLGRELCDLRALAQGLRSKSGRAAGENANKLDQYIEWTREVGDLQEEHFDLKKYSR